MVKEVIEGHQDEALRAPLRAAFERLMPAEVVAQPLRQNKRAFRDRFERFLNDIQGLLFLTSSS